MLAPISPIAVPAKATNVTSPPGTISTKDKCYGDDGSWQCGHFESYASMQSYDDINAAIEAYKDLDYSSESDSIGKNQLLIFKVKF